MPRHGLAANRAASFFPRVVKQREQHGTKLIPPPHAEAENVAHAASLDVIRKPTCEGATLILNCPHAKGTEDAYVTRALDQPFERTLLVRGFQRRVPADFLNRLEELGG